MENILLTLVVILLVLVLIMLAGLAALGWRVLQGHALKTANAELNDGSDRFHPEVRKRMEEAKKARNLSHEEANCHLHPQEPSEGACGICDQYFCRSCLKPHRNLVFCREHYNVFLAAEWAEAHTVKSTPQDPEAGVQLVEWKKRLWREEAVPMYLETHYKINVDGDKIESWIVSFARTTEVLEIKERLEDLESPPAVP
jgi:hypothetical protein